MLKNKKYLVIDTETGGLDPKKNSILSAAGVLWTPGEEVRPIFDIYVREYHINVEDKALEVNKIDMNKVYGGMIPPDAVKKIKSCLDAALGTSRRPITLVGHNINFDIGFMKRLYRHAGSDFSADFRDRGVDSCSLVEFLRIAGKIDANRSNADVLFRYGDVSLPEKDRHTALGDACATAKALETIITKL